MRVPGYCLVDCVRAENGHLANLGVIRLIVSRLLTVLQPGDRRHMQNQQPVPVAQSKLGLVLAASTVVACAGSVVDECARHLAEF